MAHWRMQLHPAQPGAAVMHTVTSLAAGYIGLDFGSDVGNLLLLNKEQLPEGQRDFWDFAHEMKLGDAVLIITHHFPFALVEISGPYNYMIRPEPHIGVWFRHFRAVKTVGYFADFLTNAREWPQLTMTDTISPLHDPSSKSYQLIEDWLSAA